MSHLRLVSPPKVETKQVEDNENINKYDIDLAKENAARRKKKQEEERVTNNNQALSTYGIVRNK